MTPLIALLGSFGLLSAVNAFLLNYQLTASFVGRASLAVMLLVTGIAHFTKTDLMVATMPDAFPMKKQTVYLTGVLELLATVGLLINQTSHVAAIGVMLFFIAILPANIVGSLKRIPLGGMAKGANYLYFRIPLQIFFIAWTYYFGIAVN